MAATRKDHIPPVDGLGGDADSTSWFEVTSDSESWSGLGDLFKDSDERGVYKSTDGGESWERVLFANDRSGAVDLAFDPVNPDVLYASTWNVRRTPYDFSSGGEGSALWTSEDGGDTWASLMQQEGMPEGPFGIIGVTVSPVNPDRVWAIMENDNGGVYRSDDAGET